MLLLLGKRGQLVRLIHFAVDAHAHIALLLQALEQLRMFALARPDERRHDLQPRPLRQREQLIDHLVRCDENVIASRAAGLVDRLLTDFAPAFRAVRDACARVEQTQVVVNFRHRADGRTRIARRRLLVDGNGRGKAVDAVQIRFVHLAEKLPRVGRKRFNVPPLPFGVNRIERQRRFAAARKAGKDDQLIARNFNVDIFQVVLSRALDNEFILHCFILPFSSWDACGL